MRSKIIFIVIFLFMGSVSLMYISEAEKSKGKEGDKEILPNSVQTTNVWLEKFYVGAVQDGIDCGKSYATLDTLGFNLWHRYSLGREVQINLNDTNPYPKMYWGAGNGSNYSCEDIQNDKLMENVSEYSADVITKFQEVNQENQEMRIIIQRPKIEYLCYGQRSDYQCENILDTLWFYSFNQRIKESVENDTSEGKQIKVIHCIKNTDEPGIVVKSLRANTEQCHEILLSGNEWFGDRYCGWKIKPRIRVDSMVARDTTNFLVCNIKVYYQDGSSLLLNTDIKAWDFRDGNGNYNGEYKDDFEFSDNRTLNIDSNWGNKWGYDARGMKTDGSENNKADIQVYWYGNCDMWIDYLRVDNEVADELFKGIYDSTWLYEEIQQIALETTFQTDEPIIIKYYLEVSEFNNIPCMTYVNEKLKYYSDGKIDLIQDLTNTISVHLPWYDASGYDRRWIENPDFLYHQYIKKVGFTQVFLESYPLTACYTTTQSGQNFSRLPNTLGDNLINNPYVLAQIINSDVYDTLLQDNINREPYVLESGYTGNDIKCGEVYQDAGNFRYRLELGDALSKLADIPFIFMPQAHQWYKSTEVRREPTNEELNMMVNTSLCYGVKGMLYFAYNSIDLGGEQYGTGIADDNLNLRHLNYYGQTNPDKVQTLIGITERVAERWGPYIIKFDNNNRKSAIYDFELQRQDFLNSTYFNEIRTYPPTPSDLEIVSSVPDDPQYTYIQSAVFQNPSETGKNYFMLVNRRCAPYDSGENQNGGRRRVKIKFDANSTEFLNFKNWVVIDLYNNSKVAVFDKSSGSQIDLGWYLPGEGKLYTIQPVMQTGGTIVAMRAIK